MTEKTIEIKVYEGVMITFKGKELFCESPADIWKAFKWDIENDDMARQCATEITRNLIAFGQLDIPNDNGENIHLQVIPCKAD